MKAGFVALFFVVALLLLSGCTGSPPAGGGTGTGGQTSPTGTGTNEPSGGTGSTGQTGPSGETTGEPAAEPAQDISKFFNKFQENYVPDCTGHYAYVLAGDNDKLFFDGKEFDSGTKISDVFIFGGNIAYVKDGQVFFNKQAMGSGEKPQVWANHIAFVRKDNSGKKFFYYDGNNLGETTGSFIIWGNHGAFAKKIGSETHVIWDGKDLGKGSLIGIHKGFVMVQSGTEYNLYKDGQKVITLAAPHNALLFGDNWLATEGLNLSKSLKLNGNTLFSSDQENTLSTFSPRLFGNNYYYCKYNLNTEVEECNLNGQTVNEQMEILGKQKGLHASSATLFENNLAIPGDLGFYYNGKIIGAEMEWSSVKLSKDNWIATTSQKFVYFNGKYVATKPSLPRSMVALSGNNYALLGTKTTESEYTFELIENGEKIGQATQFALFGEHIGWEKNYDNYKGTGKKNIEYYIDKQLIGVSTATEGQQKVKNITVWPKIDETTEIGSKDSARIDQVLDHANNFNDVYLYCNSQWQ